MTVIGRRYLLYDAGARAEPFCGVSAREKEIERGRERERERREFYRETAEAA